MDITIREMTENDILTAVSIITSHSTCDGECAERYYKKYFKAPECGKDRERNFVAVVKDINNVVGVCGYSPDKYNGPGILWLNWFYVAKTHIGQGIGLKLIKYTISKVIEAKTMKLYLDTSNHLIYAKARRMYERLGFVLEGDLVDYYDKGENCLIYGLKLLP